MGRFVLSPLLVAHVAEGRLGMQDDAEANNVPLSTEVEGGKGSCLWCEGAPPTESHRCHNAHRKPKKCPELDDAFTREQVAEFDKLCKPYKENTWYNNLLNCAVRRVAVVAKQSVAHIEAEDTDGLMNYLLKMGDISVDFDEIAAIPAPHENAARAAGVCLHKLWWSMMRANEQVYNATIRLIKSKGGKDYEGPWGWRDGTCTHNSHEKNLESTWAIKTTKYALGRAMFANYLRHASSIGDKYYIYPFVNFFRTFSNLKYVFQNLGSGGKNSRLTAIQDAHLLKTQDGPSKTREFKPDDIPTLDEIELDGSAASLCFSATIADVSSPYMMRAIGGIDQFMETKTPKGQAQGGSAHPDKCANGAMGP